MTLKDIKINPSAVKAKGNDRNILKEAIEIAEQSAELYETEQYDKALNAVVDGMRHMREFSDFTNVEFRATLAKMLFGLAEIHYALKDYKQSEKELEILFKVLENLTKEDPERFGELHVLAMELSTRILRSRKKTMELLAKQQINTGIRYEKENAGVAAATDKLVESLRKGAEKMAQTGDYKGAVRFFMEAIKLAKKRTGRISRREVRMTVDMARVMMHSKSETPRARRLLQAILPHAVALENLDLEQEILAMIEKIDADANHEPIWRTFMEKLKRIKPSKNVDDTEHERSDA